MEILDTDFTKELNELLHKYKKNFGVDKNGIYLIDSDYVNIKIMRNVTPSFGIRDRLIPIEII